MSKPLVPTEPEVLQRVSVRLLQEHERDTFDRLLENQHYLASARLAGQTLRYVAELDGQWVALLTFSAAAFHLKLRERWIRWTPRQCARRLLFVVNNSRFLVLPERARYPNLASRVLGLCLRRLGADWETHWQHPVLVVESFVDESRYRGTCYRACGFAAVGPTEGFARASRDFYQEHGQPKQLYLRELRPGARHLLRRGRLPRDLAEHEEKITGPCPLRAGQLGSLLERFGQLHDGRRGHGLRHRQPYVLACAATATLMGGCGYQAFEDTCKKFTQRQLKALGCQQDKHGRYAAPSDTTFFRVLTRLDPAAFAAVVGAWFLEQDPAVLARLAVDGKVLRGSGRTDGQPLQLLSAVSHHLRLTLAQVPIAQKSNEIPALQPLLRQLPALQGTLITADALHCQQESARFITQELGGDYLFGLKGNQSGVLERAERLLAQEAFPPDDQVEWDKGHGRLDRRRLKRVTVTPEAIGLCGCWQVIAVRRERIELGRKAGPPTDDIAYYCTSTLAAQADEADLLGAIRGHWDASENGTHYRRDVTFGEDACGVSQRGAAQVLATLRNLALGLHELARARGVTTAPSTASSCRQLTFTQALAWLRR